ncbi:hypothetical protein HG530_001517 [Fusarium avenaceum]|nr:hypothetical protein HG530_001517 [Fusarium avenaceum]
MLENGASEEEGSPRVEVEDIMPRLVDPVVIRIVKSCRTVDARAVDQDVNLAKGLCRRVSQSLWSLGRRQVGLYSDCSRLVIEALEDLVCVGLVARVGVVDYHRRPAAEQFAGNSGSQSRRGPADQSHFTRQ